MDSTNMLVRHSSIQHYSSDNKIKIQTNKKLCILTTRHLVEFSDRDIVTALASLAVLKKIQLQKYCSLVKIKARISY